MKRVINEIIVDFAETQNCLCQIVIGEYDLKDDGSVLFDAPKAGAVESNGEGWTFKRHGSGLRFTRVRTH